VVGLVVGETSPLAVTPAQAIGDHTSAIANSGSMTVKMCSGQPAFGLPVWLCPLPRGLRDLFPDIFAVLLYVLVISSSSLAVTRRAAAI
jgi:hypothetical protein